MALMTDDLLIKVELDAQGAIKGFKDLDGNVLKLSNDLMQSAGQGAKKAETGFSGLESAIIAANQAIELTTHVVELLDRAFEATVGEFLKTEDAVTKVSNVLALMGEKNVPGVTDEFRKFAEQMQETALIQDEQTLSLVAMGKAAGFSNDMTEKLVQTAANMAVITGDVDSNFRGLIQTTKGNARGIGELSVLLKGFTEDQLKAGKGVDYLAERFKGATQVIDQTFAGGVKRLKLTIQETMKDIGEVIAKGLRLDEGGNQFVALAKKIRATFDELKPDLIAGLETVRSTVKGIASALALVDWEKVAQGLEIFGAALLGVAAVELTPLVVQLGLMAAEAIAAAAPFIAMAAAIGAVIVGIDLIAQNMKPIGSIIDNWKISFVSFFTELERDFLSLLRTIGEGILSLTKKLGDVLPGFSDISKQINESLGSDVKDLSTRIDGLNAELKTSADAAAKDLEDAFNNFNLGSLGNLKEEFDKFIGNVKDQINIAKNEAHKATQTIKGGTPTPEAQKPIVQLFSEKDVELIKRAFGEPAKSFADTANQMTMGILEFAGAADSFVSAVEKMINLVPGLIEHVAKVIDELTDLPNALLGAVTHLFQAIEKFFAEFAQNIVNMVRGVIDDIGSFVEKLPDIILQTLSNLPDMINKLLDHIPDVVESIAKNLVAKAPDIALAMFKAFYIKAPLLGAKLIEVAIIEIPKAIVKGIIDGLIELRKELSNFFKGVKIPGVSAVTDGIKEAAKKVLESATKIGEQVFKIIDINAQAKGRSVADDIAKAAKDASEQVGKVLKGFLAELRDIWNWVWAHIFKPIIDAFYALWDAVKGIFDAVISGLSLLWNTLIKPIGDALVNGLKDIWGVAMKLWQDVIAPIGQALVDGLSAVWRGVDALFTATIKPVFDGLEKTVTALGAVVQGIGSGLQAAAQSLLGFKFPALPTFAWPALPKFTWPTLPSLTLNLPGSANLQSAGSQMTDGLIGSMQSHVQFFKDIGSKITEGIVGSLSSAASTASSTLVSSVKKFIGLSTGGMIYAADGQLARGSDVAGPFMLTPGEGVLNVPAVQAIGPDNVRLANSDPQAFLRRVGNGPSQTNVTNVQQSFELNIKIETEGKVNEKDLANKVIDRIKADSHAGKQIVSKRGVF